ncbi:MAG: hypothetical protein ABFC73_14445 [Clostridiaceae bacterium]
MKTKAILAKVFAIAGTVLVWAPILLMLVTGVVGSIAAKTLLLDYLMLAELFYVVVAGLILLFLASLLGRSLAKWIGFSAAFAVIALAVSLLLAQTTGLATGAIAAVGWPYVLVLGLIILYNVLVLCAGIFGLMLVKALFRKQPAPAETPAA